MPNFSIGDLLQDAEYLEAGGVWFVLDCEDGTSIVSSYPPLGVCVAQVRKQEERGGNPSFPMHYATTGHLQFLPE